MRRRGTASGSCCATGGDRRGRARSVAWPRNGRGGRTVAVPAARSKTKAEAPARGDDRSNDLHPFAAFGLEAVEDAPRFPLLKWRPAAKVQLQRRPKASRDAAFPRSGAQRQRPRGARKRSRLLRALPLRDHAHRSLDLRRLYPHVVPLAGEIDRPGEGALAQRPRLTRAPFRRLGRAQRPGGREGDVDKAQATEPNFQALLGDLTLHLVADQAILAPELERHRLVVRGLELRPQAVARLQSELDVDDRSRFRARGRRRGGNEQEDDRGCRGEE